MCRFLALRRSSLSALFVAANLLTLGRGAMAQTGDLRKDVEKLEIRLKTKHYELSGTVSDDRLAEYGRCLEFIYSEYASGFRELLARPPQRQAKKSSPSAQKDKQVEKDDAESRLFPVVIFAADGEYQEFGARYFGGRVEHTRGMYVPAVRLLLIRDELESAETYEVLFHEAFHQFMHRHIPAAPVWINEGLATYYGTARVTPQGLAFDRPRSEYADLVATAASAKRLIPLDDLMAAAPTTFYSGEPIEGVSASRSMLSYAQSYTLVAYMLADPDGQQHLRKYLRDLAAVETSAQAKQVTLKSFPPPLLSGMVTEWLQFVNRH